MKKLIYGLAAVTLAIGAVQATKAKTAKFLTYYFPYTSTSGIQFNYLAYPTASTTVPTSLVSGCNGSGINCDLRAATLTTFTVGATKYWYPVTAANQVIDRKH
ncbi:MAG: hypothetical protein ABUT20_24220 [Bacteroidota bacterium]